VKTKEGIRMKMIHYKDYVAGWLDSSIHDVLQALPNGSKTISFALITCLDSNLQPASLLEKSPELRPLVPHAKSLGTGLLVPTKLLLEAHASHQLFFGFDEICFFPTKQIKPKPDSLSLVGPGRIDQTKLGKLGKWMSSNSCSLALGDGEGLNFIVKARGLVKHLLGHSIEQPQPKATFVASPSRVAVG
jgi:hypothetical protein